MIDYLYAYQSKIVSPSSGVALGSSSVPTMTMRFQFTDESTDFDPTQQTWYYQSDAEWTHVEGSVWDFHYPHEEWDIRSGRYYHSLFGGAGSGSTYLSGPLSDVSFNVISANLDGVTEAARLFRSCSKMKSICLFDTSRLRRVECMFERDPRISHLPDFDFSSVDSEGDGFKQLVDMSHATLSTDYGLHRIPDFKMPNSGSFDFSSIFNGHRYAEGGLLNMYEKMKNIAGETKWAFLSTGTRTDIGKIEIKRIPQSWGGAMR